MKWIWGLLIKTLATLWGWVEYTMDRFPYVARDFLKGLSLGFTIGIPLLAVWLSFRHPSLFKMEYMREISLLLLWVICMLQMIPLRSLKVGKDSLEFELVAQGISPKQAIQTTQGARDAGNQYSA